MITKTIYTDLEKLYNVGEEEASLIIRLMIASNDITTSNHALSTFKNGELKPTQEHIRHSYRMYFFRIQTGHLYRPET
jgi:hypothetical protein